MDANEKLKEIEDKIAKLIDPLDGTEKMVAYKYLYHQDCRMEGIDYKIAQSIRKSLTT